MAKASYVVYYILSFTFPLLFWILYHLIMELPNISSFCLSPFLTRGTFLLLLEIMASILILQLSKYYSISVLLPLP